MSEINTNKISTISSSELTLAAIVNMTPSSGIGTPTNAAHLCRKDYVDSHSRIGATVSFSMIFNSTYNGSTTFGFTHIAGQTTITFPTGIWTGWAVVATSPGGAAVNFQAFTGVQSTGEYAGWGTEPNDSTANTNAMFCLTRVS